ncbi:MAG: M23 family metallopeptidase [Planctomycetes bacterium]|nr:M23 family metallopeptidase [Planctomycetota bacterium]
MQPYLRAAALALGLLCATARPQDPQPVPSVFEFPCLGYAKAVNTRGSFGFHVPRGNSPFQDSWHLAEDVWLPAGSEVHAIADGVVRYSAFSPTWTDAQGETHWNLGNVVVIEHPLQPSEKEAESICSFYVHLAADRRVKVGESVKRGDVLGRIGKAESEENGRYPAHLHFGIHLGPYLQIPPMLERELRTAAKSKQGLCMGAVVLRGEIVLERSGVSDVRITAKESGANCVLSLLVGSTCPKDPPPDIALWCQGYGDQATLQEWLRPSAFLAARHAR